MSKSFVILALIAFSLASLVAPVVPRVSADWLIDGSGSLVKVEGSVLGEDIDREMPGEDDTEPTTEELDRNSEEQLRELRQRQAEQLNIAARKKLEAQTEARKAQQLRTGQKSNFELRSEDERHLKLRQEMRDNNGGLLKESEIEIEDDSLHIEQENGGTIEVKSLGRERLEIIKNKMRTRSEMNLNIGEKNEINVTLPNGKTREVALPDKALEKLVVNGVLTPAEGSEGEYVLTAGKNGEPVYEVEGTIEKRLLGLFKLKFEHKLEVAAGDSDDGSFTTGDVLESTSQEKSPWRRLLERLAI